jgi:hypothetical protein
MGHEDLRVLLEDGGHRDDGDAARHVVEGAEEARAHVEVETAGGEELSAVDLRTALPDGDVEAVAAIDARGDRVIEAAVLALRAPVRPEDHAIRFLGACDVRSYREGRRAREQSAPGDGGGGPRPGEGHGSRSWCHIDSPEAS